LQTLLDTSKREEVSEIMDIDLSRDEDSVTSLAVVDSSEASATIYAGINSSAAEQEADNNEHLRSFRIEYPPKTKAEEDTEGNEKSKYKAKTTALGKASLFKGSSAAKKETYQRITRLSPATQDGKARIAALASGLAPRGQLLLLNALTKPAPSMVVDRIDLSKDEAADVDMIEDDSGDLLVAFCTADDVLVYRAKRGSSSASNMPYYVHTIPPKDVFDFDQKRPSLRSLRFLTPNRLLLLQNRPNRTGVDLLVLHLNDTALGTVTFQKRLHKSMKAAVALTICILSKSHTGEKQFAIAVAGSDISIEVLTLDYTPTKGLSKFTTLRTLRNVHPLQMTALTFSTFFPPPMPVTATTPPQHIKLASVSMGNTVAVHTFPLYPHPPTKTRTPRYVLTKPGISETISQAFAVFFAIVVVCFAAFLLQAFLEIRGGSPAHLGAAEYLPAGLRRALEQPFVALSHNPVLPTEIPIVRSTNRRLRDLLGHHETHKELSEATGKNIMVRDVGTDISAELHHDEETLKRDGKRWEELSEPEKRAWRKKLVDTGRWAAEEGETVLKGVFFGELAGIVGGIVGGGG
jgi:glycyl-tRNA synthetase